MSPAVRGRRPNRRGICDFHSNPTGICRYTASCLRAGSCRQASAACCLTRLTCCLACLACCILISSNCRSPDLVCTSARNFTAGVDYIDTRHNSNGNRHQKRCPAVPGRIVVAENVLPACLTAPANAAPPQDVFGDDERRSGGGGAVEEESTKDNGDATWDSTE